LLTTFLLVLVAFESVLAGAVADGIAATPPSADDNTSSRGSPDG
jgi:hypothetical protein